VDTSLKVSVSLRVIEHMFVEVAEAEERLVELLDAGADAFDDSSLLDLVSALARLRRVADALEARALRRLMTREVTDKRLGLKTTTWYARQSGCSRGHARAHVATEHCDGHHIHHWPHGGHTSLDNAVLLCRHHHRVIHRHHWQLHWNDGRPTITTPDGTTHPTQRHHRTRGPTPA
jgi:hypothetical protein